MSRRGRLGLAVAPLLGALATLGFAPADRIEVFLAAFAGLIVCLDGAGARRAALLGWLFGLGYFVVGVSWVYVSMHDVGGMPAALAGLAVVLFAAYLAAFGALACAAAGALGATRGGALLLVLPAAWCVCEWLRGWVFTGFPWLAAGYADSGGVFAGYAPVLGVYGVGMLNALAAAGIADLWHRLRSPAGLRPAGRDLAWIAALAAGALLARVDWTEPTGAPVTVALLQGNVPQDLKFEEERFAATLALYERLVRAHPADIVVLPETALPRMLHAIPRDYLAALEDAARARRADIVFGVPIADSRERYFNSVASRGASPPQRYDKAHLVPFGEFVPPGFRWFVDWMRIPLGDFTRGSAQPRPLALGSQRVAANICYEDLFGEEIIRQLPEATLLLNVSNIAWFGDSLAPHQHLQISRVRARETGRPMLRATNTGATAVIDARGGLVDRLPDFTEGALVARVRGHAGATPYVRTGNAPLIVACLVVLAVAWRRARGRARA
ncbi:MAG: apolipoprotein N-acyltransferase [Burkholderiales bacterium]|nr:apolipoprotein N-acyltransferase [Burkholderiales bacterium]